jgi:hypothetical protein
MKGVECCAVDPAIDWINTSQQVVWNHGYHAISEIDGRKKCV